MVNLHKGVHLQSAVGRKSFITVLLLEYIGIASNKAYYNDWLYRRR